MIGNTVVSIKKPFVEKSTHPFQVLGRGGSYFVTCMSLVKYI